MREDPDAFFVSGFDFQYGFAVFYAADWLVVDVASEAANDEFSLTIGKRDDAVGESLSAESDSRTKHILTRRQAELAGA